MTDASPEISELPALSSMQTRVIVALAQGDSVSTAADTAGVHRTTVHRWLKDPAFAAALSQTRDDFIETIGEEFKTLTGLALIKLRMLLESQKTPPAVAARVSLSLLSRSQFPKRRRELAAIDDPDVRRALGDDDPELDDASLEDLVESDA